MKILIFSIDHSIHLRSPEFFVPRIDKDHLELKPEVDITNHPIPF